MTYNRLKSLHQEIVTNWIDLKEDRVKDLEGIIYNLLQSQDNTDIAVSMLNYFTKLLDNRLDYYPAGI